ncbi:MAG: hypothetical protein WC745_04690 [Patescibacteria group bacterium]|jgi:hypothetical protein
MDKEINFLEGSRKRENKKRPPDKEKEKIEWTSPEKLKALKEAGGSGGVFGGWKEVLSGLLKKGGKEAKNGLLAKTSPPSLPVRKKNYPDKRREVFFASKMNKINKLKEEISGLFKTGKKNFLNVKGHEDEIRPVKEGAKKKIQPLPETPDIKIDFTESVKPKPDSTEVGQESFGAIRSGEEKKIKAGAENESESGDWAEESFRGTNLIKERVSLLEIKKRIVITFCLLIFSFFAVGAAYYSLGLWEKGGAGEKARLVNEAESLSAEKKVREKDLSEVFIFENRLQYAKLLLDRHIYFTNFFDFLEKNTLEDVFYSDFAGDNGGFYTLNAIARDFNNIARQVEILRADPLVRGAASTGGEYAESGEKSRDDSKKNSAAGVSFKLNLELNKSIFNNPPE